MTMVLSKTGTSKNEPESGIGWGGEGGMANGSKWKNQNAVCNRVELQISKPE